MIEDGEGIKAIRKLRHEAPLIPTISGSSGLYLDAASKLGASVVMEKPFGTAELLANVGHLLSEGGG